MNLKIVILAGDGIGPEVCAAGVRVLEKVCAKYGHDLTLSEQLIGGAGIDLAGSSLPDAALVDCLSADAVLLGAVGGPKWDDPDAADRPEKGLLKIRKEMGLFANLRPVKLHPDLTAASPLKAEKLVGVDLLVVRELTGGLYFGEGKRWIDQDGQEHAYNKMSYSQSEIRRIVDMAFKAAQGRSKRLASIDKANVLDVMRLWRKTVVEVAEDYPDVTVEHVLVDAATMYLLSRPASFDVMVASNMFGDIITDEASMLSGSMGNLPSAALGETLNRYGNPRGMYEPIHGSAPDIAGQGIANPIGTILSLAMMLRHSFGLEDEAVAIESAVDQALSAGHRTGDLARGGEQTLTTAQMANVIMEMI